MQPKHYRFPDDFGAAPFNLTLSANTAGVITVFGSQHTIDTFGSEVTGELATINALQKNQLYLLRPQDGSHAIVIKHCTGNLFCIGNADITLDDVQDFVLVFAPNTSVGYVMSGSGGGAAATTKYAIYIPLGSDTVGETAP